MRLRQTHVRFEADDLLGTPTHPESYSASTNNDKDRRRSCPFFLCRFWLAFPWCLVAATSSITWCT